MFHSLMFISLEKKCRPVFHLGILKKRKQAQLWSGGLGVVNVKYVTNVMFFLQVVSFCQKNVWN